MLEKRDDLEGENIYLLTKINQILEGNLMKLWKHKLGSKMWIYYIIKKMQKSQKKDDSDSSRSESPLS